MQCVDAVIVIGFVVFFYYCRVFLQVVSIVVWILCRILLYIEYFHRLFKQVCPFTLVTFQDGCFLVLGRDTREERGSTGGGNQAVAVEGGRRRVRGGWWKGGGEGGVYAANETGVLGLL